MFGHFVNDTGLHIAPIYIVLIGLLLAQYTFTGYDASAHMTEETHSAARSGPRGIVMSIFVSLIAGWVLLIGITFAIQHYEAERTSATGVPPAQIFIDAAGSAWAKFLLLVVDRRPAVLRHVLGHRQLPDDLRVLPGRRAARLPRSGTGSTSGPGRRPTRSGWPRRARSSSGLPYLWNSTAYAAVTSIAVIGLYIAYVIPTFLRLRQGDNFQRGPWHLGRWSKPVGIIAVTWVVIITILFMLPQVGPITWTTFNYAVFAVVAVIGFAGIYWLVSARNWFTGPRVQGTPEELAAIEEELAG